MRETTYPVDIAAVMLGCQQKKIIAEWARGTFRMVLDLGAKPISDPERGGDIFGWHDGIYVIAPATTEYLPQWLIDFKDESEIHRHHDYPQAGFYFSSQYSGTSCPDHLDGMKSVLDVLLYGYWSVTYEEFSRLHVQDGITLHPYSPNQALDAISAIIDDRGQWPDKKELRVTKTDLELLGKLLTKHPTRHQEQVHPLSETTAPQEHKNTERFALGRERILAAALYVAHHYKSEIGKTFKSHADCIDKYGYLFWKDEPVPDHERITKVLSDATRRPEEWKILGGRAKKRT